MYKGTVEDVIRKMYQTEKKLDAVNPVAVKKKFDDRKDKDIDNDLISYSCFYDSFLDFKVEENTNNDCSKLLGFK